MGDFWVLRFANDLLKVKNFKATFCVHAKD